MLALNRVRSPKFQTWILCIALSQVLSFVSLFADDTGCDMLSVKLGGTGETQTHSMKSAAKAREFIWLHWTHRTCGELFITAWSKEGVRTDSVYKVELTRGNTVVLKVTLSRTNDPSAPVPGLAVSPSGRVESIEPETRSYQATTIERIEVKIPFIAKDAKTIPDAITMPSMEYRLRFRDKDDKVLTAF
jgi:hypothetical protein